MGSKGRSNLKKKGKSRNKTENLRKRRDILLKQVLRGDSEKLFQKVAHILNQYPKARDSDIALIIYLLKTFYPTFINNEFLSLSDLYKLPHFYDMQRERARIQNEYKLFQASPKVRLYRRKHQKEKAEDFAAKTLDYKPLFIFADESGKNEKYLVIGSIWLYSSADYHGAVEILNKQKQDVIEFHFTKIKNNLRAQQAASFFEAFFNNNLFSSFKALVLKNSDFNVNQQLAAVYNGLAELLIEGTDSELKSFKISPPVELHVTKDADIHTDVLQLPPMNRRIVEALNIEFQDKSIILNKNKVKCEKSEKSELIQIADIFTGSINRWINRGLKDIEKDPKDWLAFNVGKILGLEIDSNNKVNSTKNMCKIIYLE
ncbi:MAG: DUF3800 domain-containing protein [Bacteroidetes bacterium]|nr:DUF3800 domain-containing protein [Bacteroidota bacterium]